MSAEPKNANSLRSERPSSSWAVRFRAIINGFWALIVGLSVITAFIVFRSDVTFETGERLNPDDPFSTQFVVSNEGSFPIEDVRLSCRINNLTTPDQPKIENQDGSTEPTNVAAIEARKREGFFCRVGKTGEGEVPAARGSVPEYRTADITLTASYRPYFWGRRTQSERFRGLVGAKGNITTWGPQAGPPTVAYASDFAKPSGPIFQEPVNYSSENTHPNSVALGDFNGDGKLDLVFANSSTNTVGVRLGNGDGTFQAEKVYAAGSGPYSVVVADFNLDGKFDVAVSDFGAAGGAPGVDILLGNGDGTFQEAKHYDAGDQPTQLAVADFNGDGRPDLAVTNRTQDTVTVLLGNGDGSFQAPQNYKVGRTPIFVAVGDFNLDGKPDMVVANNGDNSVSVLLGNGDGTFQKAQTLNNVDTGVYGPYSIVVADFNGDKKPDLAVANFSEGTISVLLGNGNGTFQEKHDYPTGDGPFTLAQGKFLGNGKLDLVTANNSNTVSVLLGNGDGTVQPVQNYKAGYSPASVAVGDFNGDGKPDLAVANRGDSTISVLLNISNRAAR
jgi:hypothetical protein